MRSFTEKHAVITGAASGIGRAIAVALSDAGCHTCLIDIDALGLEQTVNEVQKKGVKAFGLTCNIADKNEVSHTLNALVEKWPSIDLLVNNAGITYRGRSDEMAQPDWERLLAVNLLGPMQITQRLLPFLLARPEAHVLNICSLLGLCGFSKFAAYSASKFGMVGYSEALRAEYLRSQLGVTAVCPGYVRTPFIESVPGKNGVRRERSTPQWLCTSPEIVALASLKAIRRNRGLVVLTPLAHVTWRLKRFFPSLFELPRLLKSRRMEPPDLQ